MKPRKKLFIPHERGLFVVSMILNVLLVVSLVSHIAKLNRLEEEYTKLNDQVIGNISSPGLACGLFASDDAKSLMANEPNTSSSVVPNFLSKRGGSPTADECKYESEQGSSEYIQVLVLTYENEAEAAKYLPDELPVVNEKKQYEDYPGADEVLYDAGVFYALKGKRIIEVSASNGVPSGQEAYVKQVFDKVMEGV